MVAAIKPSEHILTFSGKRFFPLAPRAADVDILDIAHALAHQCRFSGHTAKHYSVAQHSVLVASYCPKEDRLAGLLHDAAEAYLVDLPSPLKKAFRSRGITLYDEAEEALLSAIYQRFGLPPGIPSSVPPADQQALRMEMDGLMPKEPGAPVLWTPPVVPCGTPNEAKFLFLHTFWSLYRE